MTIRGPSWPTGSAHKQESKAIAGEHGDEHQEPEPWDIYQPPENYEQLRGSDRLREICKLKFAVYADEITAEDLEGTGETRLELQLFAFQGRPSGRSRFVRDYRLSRHLAHPRFSLRIHSPTWHGTTVYYGGYMDVILGDERRHLGQAMLSGVLSPWAEIQPIVSSEIIADNIARELGTTALPGAPQSAVCLPDPEARRQAYLQGRIPGSLLNG